MTSSPAGTGAPAVHRWIQPPVLAVAGLTAAAGFGQFGAVAVLADVADEFGTVTGDATLAEQAGLSATALGIGLAVVRLASLASLPLAGAADRIGRRRSLTAWCAAGLVLAAAAALSPGYWWFVVIFAASRPFLTAADTVAVVAAAELTDRRDRAKAVALVAAAYGLGAGLVAVIRGLAGDALGFRGVLALAVVPALLLPAVTRHLTEPDRYRVASVAQERPLPVLGALGGDHRARLVPLAAVVFAVAAVTGPANSFIFLYGENVVGLSAATLAVAVVAAGPAGLVGLLAGRWCADRIGRRGTAAIAVLGLAGAGLLTYSGSAPAALAGYLAAVTAGSVFAPAAGALTTELFPTAVRAAVAGWTVVAGVLGATVGLLAFGAFADVGDRFLAGASAVFIPAGVVGAALVFAIPETLGHEPEELTAPRTGVHRAGDHRRPGAGPDPEVR